MACWREEWPCASFQDPECSSGARARSRPACEQGCAVGGQCSSARVPHAVGDLLELSSTRHELLGGFVLHETGGSIGMASVSSPDHHIIKITDEFWKHVRERVRADHRIAPGEAPPTPRGGGESKKPRVADPPEKPPDEKEEDELDLRLLPGAIVYDEARERWRCMASAVSASFEDEFPDWPIEGPRSLFFAIRELRLESKNFLEHHQAWVHSSGLHRSDRAVHEHEVCCSALHFGLCYDQLNIVNCAWAERIDKRRALLEKAYRDGAQAPNFEGPSTCSGRDVWSTARSSTRRP